ncbi:hypothetical protein I3V78_21730 [Archangium primigenium]|nr:hypothetical protein [Archangium primigenium]
MDGGRGPSYLSVVEAGARRYSAHLQERSRHASRSPQDLAFREVARAVSQALERVFRTGHLSAQDLQIPQAPFARGGGHLELLNPWSVGLGNPRAPVVVLTTGPHYGLDSPEFLLEALLLQALWLVEAPVQLAAEALGIPAWSEVPFQRYPNDYYRAPSGSSWGRIAGLLALAWGEGTAREWLQPKHVMGNTAPHLFDEVYLLDQATVPEHASALVDGPPVAQREAFLGDLLAAMPEARVLLIEERPEDTLWWDTRLRLASRFLGLPVQTVKDCLQTERPTRTWAELRWCIQGARGVLFTGPFWHNAEAGDWEREAELLRMLLPERPTPV